jgi:hypothetical protein
VNFGNYAFPANDQNTNVKFGVKCSFCENVFGVAFVVESYEGLIPENVNNSESPLPKMPNISSSSSIANISMGLNRRPVVQLGNQRANVKNPNNPAHGAATNNRSNQMNPNNPAHRSSRGHR